MLVRLVRVILVSVDHTFFLLPCVPAPPKSFLLLIEFVIGPLHGTRHTPCVPYLVRVGGV